MTTAKNAAHLTEGWVRQEAGWYTLRGVGGVTRERDGSWSFFPLHGPEASGFPTMALAMQAAEAAALRPPPSTPQDQ